MTTHSNSRLSTFTEARRAIVFARAVYAIRAPFYTGVCIDQALKASEGSKFEFVRG